MNSDWSSQGYTVSSGVRLDLRYDDSDQTTLREGTRDVARGAFAFPNDQEIQQETLNRVATLGVDFSPSRDWGLDFELPEIDRYHMTVAPGDTAVSAARVRGAGDARLLARYQGLAVDGSTGLQFGLKLPTGQFGDNFDSGPQAGNLLDRGLQAGSGTADLLLGLYQFGNFSPDLGWFAQALGEKALNEREGYRPGASLNLGAGLRCTTWRWIVPQLQVNARFEGRESGIEADVANSGSSTVYLSPGFSLPVVRNRLDAYTFVELPVYQRVNGLQLEPRWLLSIGLRYRL